MKVVIFLAAVSAANIFVGVEGADPFLIRPESGRMVRPGVLQLTFKDIPNFQILRFHGNINTSIRVHETGSIEGPVRKQLDGKWIYMMDPPANVKPGVTISYWLSIQRYSWPTESIPQNFTVPAKND